MDDASPPSALFAQLTALSITEAKLKHEFAEQFLRLRGLILTQLNNPQSGYLIRVRLYYDEFGAPVVPGGKLFEPMGIGTEPLDALAEWYRAPVVSRPREPASTLSNESYFLWLVNRDGKLVAWSIPKGFRDFFQDKAKAEALRRDRLGEWQSITTENTAVVVRAAFWSDLYRERNRLVRDEAAREAIAKLNQQMFALEARFNDVYRQYQQMLAAQARDHKFLDALQAASSVAAVIQSGLNAQQVISSQSGQAATAAGISPDNNTVEWVRREVSIRENNIQVLYERVEVQYDGLKHLDDALGKAYGESGVPVPKRDWPQLIRRP